MHTLTFTMLPDEFWYGGKISAGVNMPVDATRTYTDDSVSGYSDQSVPFFVSNKGRYIWSEEAFVTRFDKGTVTATSETAEIKLYEGYETLRGAYLTASKAHFPADGNMPDETMFRGPQYCTWIELKKRQKQDAIVKYAESILASGMPAGEILIDDGWQTTFGDWRFRKNYFSDPKGMVDRLHALGFKVILWIVPFVDVKAPDFAYLAKENCLVRDANGKVALRKWWDGRDAVLDFSNPKAREWFFSVTKGLVDTYGVDGFKQDGADARFYNKDDITFGHVTSTQQTELWAKSALSFRFNELRASFKGGGVGVTQRLGDKSHNWEESNGLGSLIPNSLLLGITGHPFSCPDMIGGGLRSDFWKPQRFYDHELFIRWTECSALLPMMQFSLSLWRLKNKRTAELCVRTAKYHTEFCDYILKTARESAKTGEPIVRYMEYSFPNEGFASVRQQFMLGDDYLVAPVVEKGAKTKPVHLPKNTKWQAVDGTSLANGTVYEGGGVVNIEAGLERLIVLKKI